MKTKPQIFACGFDAAGFVLPSESQETAEYTIHFVKHSAAESLEGADGIIIPSGIFETIRSSTNIMGTTTRRAECDKDHLAKREKQVFQSYHRGGWTAFLLRKVDNNNGHWRGTDLSKRFLNAFFDAVEYGDPNPYVNCKADEFAGYMHDFGICRTAFWNPREKHKPRVLAALDDRRLAAAEVAGQFFFLPLPSIEKSKELLSDLVMKTTTSILEYKRRNDLYLPPWVEEIEFNSESLLRNEVKKLEEEIFVST